MFEKHLAASPACNRMVAPGSAVFIHFFPSFSLSPPTFIYLSSIIYLSISSPHYYCPRSLSSLPICSFLLVFHQLDFLTFPYLGILSHFPPHSVSVFTSCVPLPSISASHYLYPPPLSFPLPQSHSYRCDKTQCAWGVMSRCLMERFGVESHRLFPWPRSASLVDFTTLFPWRAFVPTFLPR